MSYVRKVGLVLIVALLAACSSDGGGDGTTEGGQPASNQELTVAAGGDQYVREGSSANLGVEPVNANIAETLTYLSPTYEVRPPRRAVGVPRPEHVAVSSCARREVPRRPAAERPGVKTTLFDRVAQQRDGGTIKAGPNSAVVVDDLTIDFTPTAPNYRVPEQVVHRATSSTRPAPTPGTGRSAPAPSSSWSTSPRSGSSSSGAPTTGAPKPN